MGTCLTIAIFIIALLLRQLHFQNKKLAAIKYQEYNCKKLEEVNDAHSNQIDYYKNRVRHLTTINLKLALEYNRIRESTIDVPLKSGRFFYVVPEGEKILMNFSEN
jgi:hypothetical protein